MRRTTRVTTGDARLTNEVQAERPPGPVFLRGGDVLILVLAIRESGMGEILKERIAEDTLVFAGYSAGSCVLGPRLPVFEPSAPPDVPKGYPAEVITEGLNIVPVSFAEH